MTYLFFVIATIWTARIIANLLSYIYLWGVKEYRFDRMMIHLGTNQGKRILFVPLRIPPVTPKSIIIMTGVMIVLSGIFMLLPVNVLWKLLIMDVTLFPLTGVFVLFLKLPTYIYHEYVIRQATEILRNHKKMIVIGITGSYGKTSTKEFLSAMLETRYKTLKTQESKNSPIAVAELIVGKLQIDHECLVVEMGAYKPGEIRAMCRIVSPEIGIITAVNPQHQDLFKTIGNTVKAKYELIQGLTGRRIAVLNADNGYTYDMGQKAKRDGCDVRYYSVQHLPKPDDRMSGRATDVRQTSKGITFNLFLDDMKIPVTTHLIGSFYASNITACAVVALACGVTPVQIARSCGDLRPLPKTMSPMPGFNGSLFIDDTFNNNPDAALAAIDFLATTKGKKILVFQPMIELGAYASYSHRAVGAHAATVCSDIFLTNDNFYEPFIEGVRSVKSECRVHKVPAGKAVSYLKSNLTKGDTVVFKGKEAARILDMYTRLK